MTVLAGCAWEPQCVTLLTKVSANASPAQSALFPVLIFCLSAGVSVRTHSFTICCHTSSSSHPQPTGLDFSAVLTPRVSVSLPALAIDHSVYTALNEPFKTRGVAHLHWVETGTKFLRQSGFFQEG